jgi:hypothetical protein
MATLPELKRELEQLPPSDLVKVCLRMARLKAENKDLLAYLLRDADDPVFYAESLKPALAALISQVVPNRYLFARQLRKSNRIISRYARFTANKQGELELLVYQVSCFHEVYKFELRSAAASRIVFKALRKADTLIMKLHEELRADYLQQLSELLELSFKRLGREYFDEKPMLSFV